MAFRVYSRVVLKSDRFGAANVAPGTVGCIVDDFEDGTYEVEFRDKDETPHARIVVTRGDIELAASWPFNDAT